MLLSPIFGVQALGGHDFFYSKFWALGPEPKPRHRMAVRVEFGFKEVPNRVSGRARKDKGSVPREQLIYFV
jgi:hypothetical protein